MGANLKPTLSLLKGVRRIIGGVKTFVVRLFVPSEVEPHALAGDVRGIVEEVGSGRRESFGGSRELLAFIAQAPTLNAEPAERSGTRPASIEGGTA